jgi:tRNA 2-thiouridine synthesizing protein A
VAEAMIEANAFIGKEMIMAVKFEKQGDGSYLLDVRGYVCPQPQLYTKKCLERIASGDVLEIIFDNPSSEESISSFIENTGDEVIEKNVDGSLYRYKVKKA